MNWFKRFIQWLFPCQPCADILKAALKKEADYIKYNATTQDLLEANDIELWYNKTIRKNQRALSIKEIEDRMMSYIDKNKGVIPDGINWSNDQEAFKILNKFPKVKMMD